MLTGTVISSNHTLFPVKPNLQKQVGNPKEKKILLKKILDITFWENNHYTKQFQESQNSQSSRTEPKIN